MLDPRSLIPRARLARARRDLHLAARPVHVGVVMDGNRRWARAAGHPNPSVGHRYGAEHLADLLRWATDWGIDHLTVYVLSADNIRKRAAAEVDYLFELLASTLPDSVAADGERWALHLSGDLGLLPERSRTALLDASARTAGRPAHLTLAVGYDGRRDVLDGIRDALLATGRADEETIGAALAGGPVKDIDLVIRTSGEVRLSGFFPWQSAGAEIYVSPRMWPAFTERDFVRALEHYARAVQRSA